MSNISIILYLTNTLKDKGFIWGILLTTWVKCEEYSKRQGFYLGNTRNDMGEMVYDPYL